MEEVTMTIEEFRKRMAQIASSWDETQFQLVEESFDTRRPIHVNEATGPVAFSGNSGYAFYKRKPNGEKYMIGEWLRETSEGKIL